MDSFMHNHQSALDNQREDDAIQYLQDTGVYPDPADDDDDYDPTPYYLYDDSFGERPITPEERHRAAFEQKLRDKG